MISKLKKLWKTISKDTQHSLVDLISKRVEMKLEETKHEMLESEPLAFKCSDVEFISGLETVYISDYILNWLKNAEAQKGNKTDQATLIGKEIAGIAKKAGFESVVFDRNGYLYHGRVKALAEAAREEGIKF